MTMRELAKQQAREFAKWKWQPGAKAEADGFKWHWYREDVNTVFVGQRLGPLVDYADPDVKEIFTRDETARS